MKSWKEYNENKKPKIVVIQGSARDKDCCPGEDSKSEKIVKEITKTDRAIFDIIDLSVKCDGVIVQPCKACVSTSCYHCHWKCSCYSKGNKDVPDFMQDNEVYDRLEQCDGFYVCTPINWSSVSSVVKSFFDRLVCCNLTLTISNAKWVLDNDIKNAQKTRAAEQSGKYNSLLKNHLEGKYAAFFAHGNNGGADYVEFSKDKKICLPVLPESYHKFYNDKVEGQTPDPKKAIMPIVDQCVYSGIFVEKNCIDTMIYKYGYNYSQGNKDFKKSDNNELIERAKKVMENLIDHLIK